MSLDAYRKQNMYGFGKTIDVLKNKANAKYDLEQYEEALKMADEVFDYYFHIQQPVYVDSSYTKVCLPPPCPSKFNVVPMVMDTLMGKMGCTPIMPIKVSVKTIEGSPFTSSQQVHPRITDQDIFQINDISQSFTQLRLRLCITNFCI